MNAQGRSELQKLITQAEDENTGAQLQEDAQRISDEEREKFENLEENNLGDTEQAQELERIADELEEAAEQFSEAADLMNQAIETMRTIAGA